MFGRWFSSEATPAAPPAAPLPPAGQAARTDAAASPCSTEGRSGTTLVSLARKLQKNTLVMPTFTTSEEFVVRLDVTPYSTLQTVGNIVLFETGDVSPLLEFSFAPNSTTLQCTLARPQDAPLVVNASTLRLGATSRIEAQLKGSCFSIWVDGIQVCSCQTARRMPAVVGTKVWASGKKHAAAAASISNFVYIPLEATQSPAGPVEARPAIALHSIPPVPETWPELSSNSMAELEFLRSNDEALDDWILTHEQSRLCTQRLQDLRERNAETARNIIVREADQRSVAERCEQGRLAAESRRRTLAALLARKEALLQRQKPEHLAAKLAEKAHAAEAGAEACITDAISAPGTLDSAGLTRFKEQFLQQKMDKHMRLAMRERLLHSG